MVGDRASLLVGSCSWLLALVLAGCGGDNSGERNSSGGSTGNTGGSGSNTGGTSSTATGGSGGGSALMPYPCDAKAPDTAEMTASITSDGKWGGPGFTGGTFTYGDGPDADTATDVKMTFPDASLKIVGNVATYSGFGLWFGPVMNQKYACIDANGYKGVSFHVVDNSTTTKTLVFSVQTHEDSPVDVANTRGGCVYSDASKKYSDCVYPSATVMVPAGGGVVEVPWSAFMSGKPVATVMAVTGDAVSTAKEAANLDGLQFQFPWASDSTAYDVDITIKDLKFY